MQVKFICSYRGEFEYEIGPHHYEVRVWAHDDGYYNGNFAEVAAWVGTVRCGYRTDGRDQFPPPEVMALFPGFVAARYDRKTGKVVYQGDSPQVVRRGKEVRSVAPLPCLDGGAGFFAVALHEIARAIQGGD